MGNQKIETKNKSSNLTDNVIDIIKNIDAEHVNAYCDLDLETKKNMVQLLENYRVALEQQAKEVIGSLVDGNMVHGISEIIEINSERQKLESEKRALQFKENKDMRDLIRMKSIDIELDEKTRRIVDMYEEAQTTTILPVELKELESKLQDINATTLNELYEIEALLKAQLKTVKIIESYFGREMGGIFDDAMHNQLGVEYSDMTKIRNALKTNKPLIDFFMSLTV